MIELVAVNKHFGGIHAVRNISLSCKSGTCLAIIGPNGAGKTTIFNCIAGMYKIESGDIVFQGKSIKHLKDSKRAKLGIIRTFQHGRLFAQLSVLENLLCLGTSTYDEAQRILAMFEDRLITRQNEPAYSLSYANRRRLEIARALAAKPKILLLDEPSAGMNPAETLELSQWLIGLKKQGQTIILIEHKLSMVYALADTILVMDEGAEIAKGSPSQIQSDPLVLKAYLGENLLL